MNWAFITVGNREIQVNGYYISDFINSESNLIKENLPRFNEEKTLRGISKYLEKNLDSFQDKITFPIITPFLEHLERKNLTLEKIIFITTDQENEYYRINDTIYIAKIIKKILKKKKNINSKLITLTKDLSEMDIMYDKLNKKISVFNIPDSAEIYLLPVGGIPAINFALILNLIARFKGNIHQFRVDEKGSFVIPVNMNDKFLKELEKYNIEKMIDKYYFAPISQNTNNENIILLADYLYNRINLNLKKATELLDNIMKTELKSRFTEIYKNHYKISNNRNELLKEIYISFRVKIYQKQYHDALLRLYNLSDNLLLKKVIELYDLDNEEYKNFNTWWKNQVSKITAKHENIQELMGKTENGNDYDIKKSGLPTYIRLIEIKSGNDKIMNLAKAFYKLSRLRNKSIAAHGFIGISLEKINEFLSQEKQGYNLDSLIADIEELFNYRFENSDYKKIIDIMKDELKKY